MIINLNGTVSDDKIEFNLCPVYFERQQFVQINELAIQWKIPVKSIHGIISSSLIDLSPINYQQQLLFFHQCELSKFFHYAPTHRAKYKIQCASLQASVFNIQLSEKQEIEKIYIQLEVTNARI